MGIVGINNTTASLSRWVYRNSSARVVTLSLLLMVIFLFLVLPRMAGRLAEVSGTAVSPDTSLIYSPGELFEMAGDYGEAGRAYYIRSRYSFDLAWPLVYTLFLAASISYLTGGVKRSRLPERVNLLPLGAFLFDILENSAASAVMFFYPARAVLPALLAPAFTFIKWLLVGASFAVLAMALVLFILESLKNRGQPAAP